MKINKKVVIAIITVILIALGVYFILQNISIENADDYQDYTPEEEISDEQLRQTKLILYFENAETGELDTEIKVVDANTLIENPAKEIMNLLIKGPQSNSLKKLVPDGTTLNDITVQNSCATINVSKEFLNFENDSQKLKIVNSIANTLSNLKEIDSIKFLIDGEENEQLKEIYIKSKI